MVKALVQKGYPVPEEPLALKITAQGGVGTAQEHDFLLEEYQLDAVGWGSPFLLVPEATAVDTFTRELLANAKEDDFYLSNISPLGVPFNSVKGTTNEHWKQKRINENKAGSSCPKRLLALSKEYDIEGTCTASKKYQDIKLEALENNRAALSEVEFNNQKNKITEKACLCVGLVNAAYLEHDITIKGQQQGVIICPGPNLAYFDKQVSLSDMVKHIYGNADVMSNPDRPHVFINELKMYVDYLKKELGTITDDVTAGQLKKWNNFRQNVLEGIDYYENLVLTSSFFAKNNTLLKNQLNHYKSAIKELNIPNLALA